MESYFSCTCLAERSLPTSRADISRATSPANVACQLFYSYLTCHVLFPTLRGLFYLLVFHANSSRITALANFVCQLFESYFTANYACQRQPTSPANFSRVTSPANFCCQLFESYLTCQFSCSRVTSHANVSRVTSPANFSRRLFAANFVCQLFESYLTRQRLMPSLPEFLHLAGQRCFTCINLPLCFRASFE